MYKIIPLFLKSGSGRNGIQKEISLLVKNKSATGSSYLQSSREFIKDLFIAIGIKKFSEEVFKINLENSKVDWFSILTNSDMINFKIISFQGKAYKSDLFKSDKNKIIFKDNELSLSSRSGKKFQSIDHGLEISFECKLCVTDSKKVSINDAWKSFLRTIYYSEVVVSFNDFLVECKISAEEKEKKRKLGETSLAPLKVAKLTSSSEVNDLASDESEQLIQDVFYSNFQSNLAFNPLFFDATPTFNLCLGSDIERILSSDNIPSTQEGESSISLPKSCY